MTTALPAKAFQHLQMTRDYAQSLPQQERLKHRTWVGVRIEALLEGYWQSRPSDAIRAEMMRDWIDALERFSPEEIRAACQKYQAGPDRARKPKTGDLIDLMVSARAEYRRSLPKPPEPPAPARTASQEERRRQAEEIMARFRSGRAAPDTNPNGEQTHG